MFHPAVSGWFGRTFAAPTTAQRVAWPAIAAQHHVLIAAPTGSGKTLAAFLAVIDQLVRAGLEPQGLADETYVVYVSPLKALSNDIHRNLEAPLAGIRAQLEALGLPPVEIRTFVRTGDTPQHERRASVKRPPHIIVTTPESLYILLGSESGRRMLASTRTVIVDEIHAVAGSKRGVHLALTLERLEALAGRKLTRVGLSATQRPVEDVARFLVGCGNLKADGSADCTIIDTGHVRERDLQLELPAAPLEAVMSGEVWTQLYDRLAELIAGHRTTLVFVNTRRQAERLARHLSERLGEQHVTAHHGSMAKESRLDAEARLKRGELRALVATASLELGIDIGEVDLVCQLASPRSIAAFLQRVGRSGHSLGGTPKGRLFPLSRDDLIECAALLAAVRRGELDRLVMPGAPLDVLAQQIVAEAAAREWQDEELYRLCARAWPYRALPRTAFDELIRMLAEGHSTRRGRHGALLHHDAVNHLVRGRRGARLTALTSGGTIPDTADYQVILEPQAQFVGTVNEDFAVESLQGDIFQLGNVSYRILRVEAGRIRVEDARGEPPTIPFWLGEAPGRTDELSESVSRLRAGVEAKLEADIEAPFAAAIAAASAWLVADAGISAAAATQAVEYLAAARAALGALPTRETIVFERFFDEAGGMQLVIHSPFGSRVNRAWGLTLRKRFCRAFNFELQAAATEDAIVLSLTTAHSFELADVARYLHSNSARALLVQALCAAPMFPVRWRWDATIALALPRFRGGRKVPAPLARMAAEDLLAAVFPDQLACAENLSGELEIPDHPLVRQAIADCLDEAMDIGGFERLLRALEAGRIRVIARDLTEPSPLALEVLSARPYAFLDDAPLEERRTQAVMSRRWLDPESAADIGKLDPQAIERVRAEAWPDAASADELHDALLWLTCLTAAEAAAGGWPELLAQLAASRRVTRLAAPGNDAPRAELWVTAERLPLFTALYPQAACEPAVATPDGHARTFTPEEALIEVVRGRLEGAGPTTAQALATTLSLPTARIETALAGLEAEGFALRGAFSADAVPGGEWCERRLLARIHRYTVKRLRAEIEPIEARDYLRFLFEWQRVSAATRMQGPDAVGAILAQLEGFEAAAGAWETEILPPRISEYEPAWLDEQCLAGRFVWTRLDPRTSAPERRAAPVRATPIVLRRTAQSARCGRDSPRARESRTSRPARRASPLTSTATARRSSTRSRPGTGLLPAQVEEALAELVALGVVNSDSFAGLRALLVPADRRRSAAPGRRRRRAPSLRHGCGRPLGADRARPRADCLRRGERASRSPKKPSSTWCGRCCAAGAWSSGGCWHARRTGCRRGAICSCAAGAWRRAARFAAGASSRASAASSSPLPRRSHCCVRRAAARRTGTTLSLSAADPLNLVGILTPGARLPSLAGNRVLYRDGVPIAVLSRRRGELPRRTAGRAGLGGAQPPPAPARAGGARRARLIS